MTRIAICLAALAALTACKGDSGSDTGGDTEPQVVDDGVSPSIANLDAYCYLHDTGDQFYNWIINGVVDDPQGTESVETFGLLEVWRGGGVIFDMDIIVGGDDGELVGSFNADTNGVPCSSAEEFLFKVIVTDDDGNTGTAEVAGRAG